MMLLVAGIAENVDPLQALRDKIEWKIDITIFRERMKGDD